MDSGTSVTPFASGHARAQAVSACLIITVIVDCLAIFFEFSQLSMISSVLAGEKLTREAATANDSRIHVLGELQILIFILTAICFLMWIHRAHRNLPAIGARNLQYSPRWAVGGFFVPFLNLVRPYQVVNEIWKGSVKTNDDIFESTSLEYAPTSPLIAFWWVTWLISNALSRVTSLLTSSAKTVGDYLTPTWLDISSETLRIAAAIMLLILIRKIDSLQEKKAHDLPAPIRN